jgi:hypothetical protein
MRKIIELLDSVKEAFPDKARKVARGLAKAGMTKEEIGPLEQTIDPPEPFKSGIPTLKKGVNRKPSPMIEARFKYAGTWKQIDRVWLGVRAMEETLKRRSVQQSFKSMKENWEGSAPARFPAERLSLFAIVDGSDEDQTYLVWPEKDGAEPEIWAYAGQGETKHKNLEQYLKWVLKG